METAISLIWQSSYANVGVAEICKQAGVTKGGFYHHFESKADLFYEASDYYWQEIREVLESVFDTKKSPRQQLDSLIELIIERQTNADVGDGNPVRGCPFFTAGGQVGMNEERVREAATEMSNKALSHYTSLIERLQQAGDASATLPAEQLARMLFSYVQGLLMLGRVKRDANIIRRDLRTAFYHMLGITLYSV